MPEYVNIAERNRALHYLTYLNRSSEERERMLSGLAGQEREQLSITLISLLQDQDPETRIRAAEFLLRLDSDRFLSPTLTLLHDGDPNVRWYICGLMNDFGNDRATTSLIDVLSKDRESDIRLLAASALGRIADERAIPALELAARFDGGIDNEGRQVKDAAHAALEGMRKRT